MALTIRGPLLVAAGIVACVGIGAAARQTERASSDAKSGTASVSGAAIDEQTRQPVKAVRLTLTPMPGGGNVPLVVESDALGRFTFDNLMAGHYQLSADKTGYIRRMFGSTRAYAQGRVLDLSPSSRLDTPIELTPQAVIAGTVRDEDQHPVRGVPVLALRYQYFFGERRLLPTAAPAAITDDRGDYRIAQLPPASYYVVVAPEPTERPAPAPRPQSRSYAESYYPSGDVHTASPVVVGAGAHVSAVDITMFRYDTFRVAGRLVDTRAPRTPHTYTVSLFRGDATGMSMLPTRMAAVSTGAAFAFENVPEGRYQLVMQVQSPEPRVVVSDLVVERDIANVDVLLGAGVDVDVALKVDGQSADAPSNQLEELRNSTRVSLRPERNPLLVFGASPSLGPHDPHVLGVLRDLGPGPYRLSVNGSVAGMYLKSARYGPLDALTGPISVTKTPARLDLEFGMDGGSVTVTAAANADGATPAVVTLIPEDLRFVAGRMRLQAFDQRGSAHLADIPPGRYRALAWQDVDPGAAISERFIRRFMDRATPVLVPAKASVNVQCAVVSAADAVPVDGPQ